MKRRTVLPYEPWLKPIAKKLRKNMTLGEVLLWQELKRGQMLGYDFDRQRPIGRYIVDFYCKDLMLAIEVDGESHYHDDAPEKDAVRQAALEDLGVRFLRFDDTDVKQHIDTVVATIHHWIETNVEEGMV
ncbi:endonuclease domain-containing protein [Roseivirga sp. BDSF3-8]|uniref:endonuclease domain-containing protein n=1 Tax=Roseivirga sp. BDSF3-8 TaxID=3241598 RepID=UPI003531F2EE